MVKSKINQIKTDKNYNYLKLLIIQIITLYNNNINYNNQALYIEKILANE